MFSDKIWVMRAEWRLVPGRCCVDVIAWFMSEIISAELHIMKATVCTPCTCTPLTSLQCCSAAVYSVQGNWEGNHQCREKPLGTWACVRYVICPAAAMSGGVLASDANLWMCGVFMLHLSSSPPSARAAQSALCSTAWVVSLHNTQGRCVRWKLSAGTSN